MKTTLIRLFALAILATSIPVLATAAQSKDGQMAPAMQSKEGQMSPAQPRAEAGAAQQTEGHAMDAKEMKGMKDTKSMKKMKKQKVKKDHKQNQDDNYDPTLEIRG